MEVQASSHALYSQQERNHPPWVFNYRYFLQAIYIDFSRDWTLQNPKEFCSLCTHLCWATKCSGKYSDYNNYCNGIYTCTNKQTQL